MAEASCSGSTPLKRLVDHESRDVVGLQDFIRNRRLRGAIQADRAFRTQRAQAPGPDTLESSSFSDPTTYSIPSFVAPGTPLDPAARLAVTAAALHIAPSRFHPIDHSQQQGPSSAPNVSNWAADFARFSEQQRPLTHSAAPTTQYVQPPNYTSMQSAFRMPTYPTGPAFMDPQLPSSTDYNNELSKWLSTHGRAGNMSEVDAAMDQMARELQLNESSLPAEEDASATKAPDKLTDLETPELGSLSIHEPQQEQVATEPDAVKSGVSEAAERLLETVQHERGVKWRESVFLSLMRDFRDGRKDIVDNEIRDTQ